MERLLGFAHGVPLADRFSDDVAGGDDGHGFPRGWKGRENIGCDDPRPRACRGVYPPSCNENDSCAAFLVTIKYSQLTRGMTLRGGQYAIAF